VDSRDIVHILNHVFFQYCICNNLLNLDLNTKLERLTHTTQRIPRI